VRKLLQREGTICRGLDLQYVAGRYPASADAPNLAAAIPSQATNPAYHRDRGLVWIEIIRLHQAGASKKRVDANCTSEVSP